MLVVYDMSKCKTIKMFAYNSKNVNQNGIVHKKFVVRPWCAKKAIKYAYNKGPLIFMWFSYMVV